MQLVTVQGSMLLDVPSARAFAALDAASRREYGVDLTITSPAGAWRSEEMVVDMYLSSPARRLSVYKVPLGGSVAKPKSYGGPGSVHQNGRCVDINNWADLGSKTLNALARRFGFINIDSTEPWHFQHDGTTGGASGGGVSPIEDKEDDMPKVIVAEGHYFIRDGVNFISIENGSELEVAKRWFGEDVEAFALGQVRVLEAMAGRDVSATDAAIVKAAVLAALAESPLDVSDADVTAIADLVHSKLDFPTAAEFAQAVRDEIIAPDA